jgi:MGT family glycosyltransferase
MRALLTSLPAYGHLHSVSALAKAMQAAGHVVCLATSSKLCSTVEQNGIPCVPAGLTWGGDLADTRPALSSTPPAMRSLRTRQRIYPVELPSHMLKDLSRVIEEFAPDVVVSERDEHAGPIAAETHGLPYALTSAGFHPLVPDAKARRALSRTRKKHGLDPDLEGVAAFRHLYLDFIPSWFAGERFTLPSRQEVAFVESGICRRPHPELDLGNLVTGRPTIYVTMGTIANRHVEVLRTVIEALRPDLNLIVSIGENRDPGELGEPGTGVVMARWVTHEQVMQHCCGVVCHAGTNTTLAALSAGRPVVLIPVLSDQPDIAQRCVDLGVGTRLDWRRLDASAVIKAVTSILEDPSYGQRAAGLAEANERAPGIRAAVRAVEEIVSRQPAASGRPLPSGGVT